MYETAIQTDTCVSLQACWDYRQTHISLQACWGNYTDRHVSFYMRVGTTTEKDTCVSLQACWHNYRHASLYIGMWIQLYRYMCQSTGVFRQLHRQIHMSVYMCVVETAQMGTRVSLYACWDNYTDIHVSLQACWDNYTDTHISLQACWDNYTETHASVHSCVGTTTFYNHEG